MVSPYLTLVYCTTGMANHKIVSSGLMDASDLYLMSGTCYHNYDLLGHPLTFLVNAAIMPYIRSNNILCRIYHLNIYCYCHIFLTQIVQKIYVNQFTHACRRCSVSTGQATPGTAKNVCYYYSL